MAAWEKQGAALLPLEGWGSRLVEVEGQQVDRRTILSIVLVCDKKVFYGKELGGTKRRGGAMWMREWRKLGTAAAGRVRWSAHSCCRRSPAATRSAPVAVSLHLHLNQVRMDSCSERRWRPKSSLPRWWRWWAR